MDNLHRDSDVDFHDVFGGPPRRHSAIYERRRSRADSSDSKGSRLSDRPVFGDAVGSPARRSQLGGAFFSDIFPGTDSGCSSPTREGWPASPGSRSPALPAQISLSMKLAKGIDQPPFSSPSHSGPQKRDASSDAFSIPSTQNNPMHSSLIRAVPLNDDSFYRQSPLSRQASHIMDEASETTGSTSLKMELQKDSTSLEGYVNSNQFHFSIYKWAGKGVTLVIPSSTIQNKSRFRRSPELVLHGADLPSYNATPTTSIASKSQSTNQDGKLLDLIRDGNDDAASTRVEEPFPVSSKKPLHIDATEESDAFEGSQRTPVTIDGEWNSEIRNLQQMFDEDRDGQGKEDVVNQVDETKNFSSGRKVDYANTDAKQQAARESSVNHGEVTSSSMEDIQVPLEQKVHGSRVKGKVRDFIKIFNYEASPKRKGIFETQDRRSKGKDGVKDKVETQVDTTSSKMVEEMKASSSVPATGIVEEKASTDTPIIINKTLKTERYGSTKSSDVHMVDDPSLERKGTPGTFSESAPEIIDVSMPNADESHFEDLEGCVIEQLTEDQNVQLQTDLHQDQIKVSDAKIREWSKGKEGNIRSLLSTLQYVLWPESGWKPVPLVNIIEGPSVKRAYQKALLYLHPDKLQQKGAAVHQKYIAEKVFDILQEAWDQFNSVSSF